MSCHGAYTRPFGRGDVFYKDKSSCFASYYISFAIIQRPVEGVAISWWRHQMETFSALLVFCAGNSPVPGEFPSQRPVTRSFDVFSLIYAWTNVWANNRHACALRRKGAHYIVTLYRRDKLLTKQLWGWWFETPSCSLWRHCNDNMIFFLPRNEDTTDNWYFLCCSELNMLLNKQSSCRCHESPWRSCKGNVRDACVISSSITLHIKVVSVKLYVWNEMVIIPGLC